MISPGRSNILAAHGTKVTKVTTLLVRSSWTEYYTSIFLVLGSDIFHSNKTYSFILPTPDWSSCLCRYPYCAIPIFLQSHVLPSVSFLSFIWSRHPAPYPLLRLLLLPPLPVLTVYVHCSFPVVFAPTPYTYSLPLPSPPPLK
jgi:hypothetical protein